MPTWLIGRWKNTRSPARSCAAAPGRRTSPASASCAGSRRRPAARPASSGRCSPTMSGPSAAHTYGSPTCAHANSSTALTRESGASTAMLLQASVPPGPGVARRPRGGEDGGPLRGLQPVQLGLRRGQALVDGVLVQPHAGVGLLQPALLAGELGLVGRELALPVGEPADGARLARAQARQDPGLRHRGAAGRRRAPSRATEYSPRRYVSAASRPSCSLAAATSLPLPLEPRPPAAVDPHGDRRELLAGVVVLLGRDLGVLLQLDDAAPAPPRSSAAARPRPRRSCSARAPRTARTSRTRESKRDARTSGTTGSGTGRVPASPSAADRARLVAPSAGPATSRALPPRTVTAPAGRSGGPEGLPSGQLPPGSDGYTPRPTGTACELDRR